MLTSHAELSGLRHGWRRIQVPGKDVHLPNKALEIPTNVRGRIWVRALSPRSKHLNAPDNFNSSLEAWDHTIRRAPLQSSMRVSRPQGGSAAADAYAQKKYWGIGGWRSPEKQFPSPGSCWWFQLEGSMADLPQSWNAGNEAQLLISCCELKAPLALLACRFRSPLPTKHRQRHRRRTHHEGVHNSTSLASLR